MRLEQSKELERKMENSLLREREQPCEVNSHIKNTALD